MSPKHFRSSTHLWWESFVVWYYHRPLRHNVRPHPHQQQCRSNRQDLSKQRSNFSKQYSTLSKESFNLLHSTMLLGHYLCCRYGRGLKFFTSPLRKLVVQRVCCWSRHLSATCGGCNSLHASCRLSSGSSRNAAPPISSSSFVATSSAFLPA